MFVISRVDIIKKTVVYLFSEEAKAQSLISVNPLGTGFFVAVPAGEGRSWIYFVTAKHVLERNSGKYRKNILCRVNLKDCNRDSSRVGFEFLRFPILDTEGNILWIVHSNPAVDIAVIQEFPNPQTYEIQAIPTKAFVTQEIVQRDRIVEGQELFFPCFTPEVPQHRRNNPVIRFGRIALISTEDFVTQKGSARFYLAECFPFGGNSGSPVFFRQRTAEGEAYALLGIMIGHYYAREPVIRETQSSLMVPQHMGIAAIMPVDYLLDILNSDAVRRERSEMS